MRAYKHIKAELREDFSLQAGVAGASMELLLLMFLSLPPGQRRSANGVDARA
jgi:hypothetical protein